MTYTADTPIVSRGTVSAAAINAWFASRDLSRLLVKAGVFVASHHTKVLGAIVRTVLVDMMDNLSRLQRSTDHLFGNETVFVDAPLAAGMIHDHVPHRDTARPLVVRRSLLAVCPIATRHRAKDTSTSAAGPDEETRTAHRARLLNALAVVPPHACSIQAGARTVERRVLSAARYGEVFPASLAGLLDAATLPIGCAGAGSTSPMRRQARRRTEHRAARLRRLTQNRSATLGTGVQGLGRLAGHGTNPLMSRRGCYSTARLHRASILPLTSQKAVTS